MAAYGGTMKQNIAPILILLLMIAGLPCLAACGEQEGGGAQKVKVYYLSNTETKIEAHEYDKPSGGAEEQLKGMLAYLSVIPQKPTYKAPLAMGFQVLNTQLQEGKLLLNVDKAYQELSPTTEVLVRAALVHTLTQVDGVSRVSITVEDKPLVDSGGEPVGWMSSDQFINNDGNEINTYEKVRIKLYFANQDGDKLIAAYREKFYSTNTPLERLVVEELLMGPSGKIEGLYPTLNSETKILSVMTKDGICYVNLDAGFLSVVNNVSLEIALYSIVNSLSELSHINQVQVLVNGEVPSAFKRSAYEKNMDCVTVLE